MSRPSYMQQEQLLYHHHQRPANIKRLRQQALPIYGRSYSLEEQPAAAAGHFVPVYSKFIYPKAQQQQRHDSLNSLDSDYSTNYDYDYEGAFVVEQPPILAKPPPAVVHNLNALGRLFELLQRWPLPRLSFNTTCICSLIIIFIAPRTCAQSLLFPAFRLFFGTLYPAYASYKAVRTKNVKEYVKWMMYWIVFAFFTCTETFTDIFLSWFPFYYEVKVVIVFWLLSPATKGSSTLYRKFVHPMLTRREQDIDEYLNQARERGYSAVLQLGSKGVNYATNVIMQTAIKGGGNLVQTIKRSYSLSDLSEPDMHRTQDELDEVMRSSISSSVMMRPQPTRLLRQRHHTPVGRSASGTRHSTGMYFTEVDVTNASPAAAGKQAGDFNYNIRSTDDISSGYSSAEPISAPVGGNGLSRTSSMTNASKARLKTKRNEQILEDMRAEVYLENERYFQALKEQQENESQKQMHAKIVESGEENDKNHVEEEDEDEESFYEAMPMLDEVEYEKPKELAKVEETSEESFKEAFDMTPKTDDFQGDPFLLVLTETRSEMEASQQELNKADDGLSKSETVSPRELLATLEQIQHSFRAQLEPESPTLRPKALHAKGRAPPPPLPPRKETLAADAVSITSTTSQERSRSGIGQLFKNIKDNVRRKSAANQQHEAATNEELKLETSI